MQDFTRLFVWRDAVDLARAVQRVVLRIASRSHPGLSGQLRRASAAIGALIAEGAAAGSRREFARYLQMAIGSASEVEHHPRFADAVGALGGTTCAALVARTTLRTTRYPYPRLRNVSRGRRNHGLRIRPMFLSSG